MTWWWLRWHRRHGQVILTARRRWPDQVWGRLTTAPQPSGRVYVCGAGHERPWDG